MAKPDTAPTPTQETDSGTPTLFQMQVGSIGVQRDLHAQLATANGRIAELLNGLGKAISAADALRSRVAELEAKLGARKAS